LEQDRLDGITPAKFVRVSRKDVSQVKISRFPGFSSAALMAMALAACQQAEPPAAQETLAAQTAPDAKPGISGSGGHLVLPVVAGRPAVVYFTVRNESPKAATLVGVHVDGAGEAAMHRTEGGAMSPVERLEITSGGSAEFAPGGLHVMAFDLDDRLKAGGSSELTLTFSDGDKLSMPLHVEAMGAQAGEGHMPGMNH
jgi:copper(I)-binding protein